MTQEGKPLQSPKAILFRASRTRALSVNSENHSWPITKQYRGSCSSHRNFVPDYRTEDAFPYPARLFEGKTFLLLNKQQLQSQAVIFISQWERRKQKQLLSNGLSQNPATPAGNLMQLRRRDGGFSWTIQQQSEKEKNSF